MNGAVLRGVWLCAALVMPVIGKTIQDIPHVALVTWLGSRYNNELMNVSANRNSEKSL